MMPATDIEFGEPLVGDIAPPRLRAFTSVELHRHTFDYRRPLLYRGDTPILREGHLAEVYAVRGIGKTWLTHTLGYIAAYPGCEALGFRSQEPARVLIVDGEMAGPELQERCQTIEQVLGVAPSPHITLVGADWQDEFLPRLDTLAGREAIEPFVDVADLIILDNRSSLFDPEAEKDPSAWQPAQDWLLSLRRRRKAVIIVHHSNRQGGARWHSKPEDVMDLLIKLTRPDGYSAEQGARFTLEFDKARGVHGAALVPFTARLHPDGWQIEDGSDRNTVAGKLRESSALPTARATARSPRTSPSPKPRLDAMQGSRRGLHSAMTASCESTPTEASTLGNWYYRYRLVSIPLASASTGIPVSLLKESTGTRVRRSRSATTGGAVKSLWVLGQGTACGSLRAKRSFCFEKVCTL